MSQTPTLQPTAGNMFVISYPDSAPKESRFDAILAHSKELEHEGEVEQACACRYEGFKAIMELIPEEEECVLDWDERENQPLLELIRATSIDHFLMGDFEMATGMMELMLDLDPEDHLEATKPLAYCYIALEEFELFDEVINDISDKFPEKELLTMWSEFRRRGTIPSGELIYFRKNHPIYYAEFMADEHPVDESYLQGIEQLRPTKEVLARELWLQTEHLWRLFPGFIDQLKSNV